MYVQIIINDNNNKRICGLTFVKLTVEDLENKIGINQIGLREQFCYERDKAIQKHKDYKKSSLKISCNMDLKLELPSTSRYSMMVPSTTSSNVYVQSQSTPQTATSLNSPLDTIDEQETNTPTGDDCNITISPSPIVTTPNTTVSLSQSPYSSISSSNISSNVSSNICSNMSSTVSPQIRLFAPTMTDTYLESTNNTNAYIPKKNLSLRQSTCDANNPHKLTQNHPNLPQWKMSKTYSTDDAVTHYSSTKHGGRIEMNDNDINNKYCLNESDLKLTYYLQSKLLLSGYIRMEIEQNIFDNNLIIPREICDNCLFEYYFEYKYHLYEISRDCWIKINNSNKNMLSGSELFSYIQHLLIMRYNDNDHNSFLICNDLIKYKYMEQVLLNPVEPGSINENNNKFIKSEYYQYKFTKEKDKELICEFEPDRKGWTRDTTVEIYSNTFGKWEIGTIANIESFNSDILLIDYFGTTTTNQNKQQMRKYVDRWDYKTIRSTKKFINDRKLWRKDKNIQIYLHENYGLWYPAQIMDIYNDKKKKIVRVYYKDNDGNEFIHYFDLWSSSLREPRSTIKYALNSIILVWSNSNKTWLKGKIVQCLPEINAVRVVYGKSHKLLSIHSDDIKLIN